MAVISKMRAATRRIDEQGFTLIQMIVIVALVSIVTTFGAIGIVNARAHMRLASSARQFSTMAEKARGDSVRRHAMGGARANLRLLSTTSYSVTMDFDGNGVIDAYDTHNYDLESDVTFPAGFVGTTITFDWRGRSVTGEVDTTMILVGGKTTLITISGAGDVTMDIESFPDGSIPDLALTGDPGNDLRPDPTPNPGGTPYPGSTSPTPTPTPNPDPNATPIPTPVPTPTPCNNNGVNCRDPSPTPTPTPQPTSPTPTPTPIPTTGPCTLTASPSSLTIVHTGTLPVVLNVRNSSGLTTVSLSGNSNTSHISVTLAPGQTGIVTGGSGTVTFNVVVNGNSETGTISFTASSPCSASTSVAVNQ
jgi:Tfp pilus assembly protein FimT